jgi:phosphoglycolate phosphatase
VCAGLTGILTAGNEAVEKAFSEAIATQGIVPGTSAYARCMVQVHRSSGQTEIDTFRALFPGNEARAQAASLALTHSFAAAIDRGALSPPVGAEAALDKLADAGLRLCLISGFSRQLSVQALRALDWHGRVDLLVSADDAPRGCPCPDPVLTAMLRLGADTVDEVAVADGTASMIESGCRAGAGLVAGILTGPHSDARLRAAGAAHLVADIAELPGIVIDNGAERAS